VEISPFSLQRQFGNLLRWQFEKQHLSHVGIDLFAGAVTGGIEVVVVLVQDSIG
jgi:hypothetical protein